MCISLLYPTERKRFEEKTLQLLACYCIVLFCILLQSARRASCGTWRRATIAPSAKYSSTRSGHGRTFGTSCLIQWKHCCDLWRPRYQATMIDRHTKSRGQPCDEQNHVIERRRDVGITPTLCCPSSGWLPVKQFVFLAG